jgi:putative endonuclease
MNKSGRTTTELGRQGEEIAAQALIAHGYHIIDRNWRCAAGEIDLIAQDRSVWVFAEVKLRRGEAFGAPEEAITPAKQKRLLKAGALYMQSIGQEDAVWRIDIIAIEMSPQGKVKRLGIYQDAIRAEE